MGLFDSIAKQALGGLLGGSANGGGLDMGTLMKLFANQGSISEAVSSLLGQAGGLSGLLEKFRQAGLGDAASSWVGSGENQNLDAGQIRSALGGDLIEGFASKVGLQSAQILPLLAQFLPTLIDQLTPSGSVDDDSPSTDKLQQMVAAVIQKGLGGDKA